MIKSYFYVLQDGGGQGREKRSEDVHGLAWGEEERLLRIQPSWDLSRLTSPVLLSHVEGTSQNTDSVSYIPPPKCPLYQVMHLCLPVARTQKVLLFELAQDHQPVWYGLVSAHRDGIRPSPGRQC